MNVWGRLTTFPASVWLSKQPELNTFFLLGLPSFPQTVARVKHVSAPPIKEAASYLVANRERCGRFSASCEHFAAASIPPRTPAPRCTTLGRLSSSIWWRLRTGRTGSVWFSHVPRGKPVVACTCLGWFLVGYLLELVCSDFALVCPFSIFPFCDSLTMGAGVLAVIQ